MKKLDMTGWIMAEHGVPQSRLTVINEVEPHIAPCGKKQYRWLCKCSCGKEVIVEGGKLRNGNTKSCGCLGKEKIIQRNISQGRIINIGDVFGKLTVIKDLGMRKQKSRNKNWRWSLCQCQCGSDPIQVPNTLLLNGHKKSCGCICSLGEEKIKKLLNKNNINFIQEYHFADLKNPKTNTFLRFDFAIFENNKLNFLIEFDGRQHFFGPEAKWKNSSSFEEIQYRDNLKNNYCKQHKIILKRIPFTDLDTFTISDILTNKYNI